MQESPKQTSVQQPASFSLHGKAESTTAVDDSQTKSESTAPSKPPGKAKRTLTADNVYRTVADVVASGPVLFEAALHPKVPAALREKLFLAVSAINDCRYCKWGHTHWALAQGVPLEEVNRILGDQAASLEARNPAEAAAILFAQHYAEELDQIDPDAIVNLHQYYSEPEVAEILAYVRFITLTNLTGNTVDAFLTGTRGQSNGKCLESLIAAAASPVALLLTQLAKFDSRIGMEELRSKTHTPAPPNSGSKPASS